MALASSIQLSNGEKLKLLQRMDQFRQWDSLDDKRYCLKCGKIISGHQIKLIGRTRGDGPLRLSCPTERCNSIPMDWVLPTAEVLANMQMHEMAQSTPRAVHLNRTRPPISRGSRWRKVLAWLRRPQ